MEDPNALAADCVVICCCCQCLILQILVLVLLRLPRKLVRKTKEYAKRKLRRGRRGEKTTGREQQHQETDDEFFVIHGEPLEIEADAAGICGTCCLQEVEVMMEKLSQEGGFGFGSFWGQMESRSYPSIASYQELGTGLLHYQLIELVTSFRHQ